MTSEGASLDACNCCEGLAHLTPLDQTSAPGLTAFRYRVGTHASFKASMLASLSGAPGGIGRIEALSTRADDDPTIALFDAAATMLDALTFYQERIANEGYLRTATERLSVLELARAIGYELKPGVAAGGWLAFEMESPPNPPGSAAASAPTPGVPEMAVIPVGTRVQSIPGQDEKPQTFETVEAITARRAWNRLRPRLTQPVLPANGHQTLYLAGTATNLRKGDMLLIVGEARAADPQSEQWDAAKIASVEVVTPDAGAACARVSLAEPLNFGGAAPAAPQVFALRQRAALFGHNAPGWRSMPTSFRAAYLGLEETRANLAEILSYRDWPGFSVAAVAETPATPGSGTGLYGEYYNNLNFTGARVTRVDPAVNFAWNTGSPAPGIGADSFSVRWTGAVEAVVTDEHTFITLSDDGVRLWVNGRLLIDNWTTHTSTRNTGTITLQQGERYDIRLEFFENAGAATITLSWSAPGVAEQIIPTARLYPRDLNVLHLDATYDTFVPGGWVALVAGSVRELYQIQSAADMPRALFALSGKTTRLTLAGENLRELFNERIRETSVFGQSEALTLAPHPITDPVSGDEITLDGLRPELAAPRTLILNGKRIRVRTRVALTLLAADGVTTAVVAAGDSLVLEQVTLLRGPNSPDDDREVYVFIDKNGFTGSIEQPFVSVTPAWDNIPSEPGDALVSEVIEIKEMIPDSDPTSIRLVAPLARVYDRTTVFIYGNVTRSTHGETRREVLGSGDGGKAFQSFELKQAPLTFVSAANAAGAETTLAVRVNDVLWRETPSLYGPGPRSRAYITRRDDEGKVTVRFGDGRNGARLPTGNENITAVYRTGIGLSGLLKTGQLALLMTRPLGVKSVTNPLPTAGAADPESRDNARENAPFTVLTLDRIVSLRDFEDFARAFAGIGKAQATTLWNGETRVLHLTVAAAASNPDGTHTIDPGSDLFTNLRLAMDAARDTAQRLNVDTYEPRYFRVRARVLVHADYLPEKAQAAVVEALRATYAFERRGFGQPVFASEVIGIMQGVEGVTAVFLTALHLRGAAETRESRLAANPATPIIGPGRTLTAVRKAQLLLIDPVGIEVVAEVAP